jgi:hypothetical protein
MHCLKMLSIDIRPCMYSSDTRKAKAKIEIQLLKVPVPIVEIQCASKCYPSFEGVYVNPTSRLALRGTCTHECDGTETYEWLIEKPTMETVRETAMITNILKVHGSIANNYGAIVKNRYRYLCGYRKKTI